MSRHHRHPMTAAAAALAALLTVAPASAIELFDFGAGVKESPVGVVEFYHAERDQYFVTASIDEVAVLDAGGAAGWKRAAQGHAFMVFVDPVRVRFVPADQAQARPVCRYFIPPSSHFLSASADECAAVAQAHPEFVFETSAAFFAWLPDRISGRCPQPHATVGGFEFQPVYRLWNNRIDTNHRLTTSKNERAVMIEQGWIAEGYGDDGVAMCVPRWY